MKDRKSILLRYLWFAIGVAINSFGIVFITKSALGTSPISSVPYVLSLQFTAFSFGVTTFVLNILFVLGEIILLRRDFKPVQFLQIAATFLFSALIDISMVLLDFLQPEIIPARLISLLIGCMILAIGVSIEVAPAVIVVPGEGIVRAIAQTTKVKFGTVKICFDVALMVTAAVLSLLFFGRLNGIGAGTVIAAFAVGKFVNIVNKRLPLIEKIRALAAEPAEKAEDAPSAG